MTDTAVTQLTPALRSALILKLTALADDELILSHRNGEWVGHAPILEEDIALANLAQDELGHALVWLNLRAQLDGSDPDGLAFHRDAHDFRCAWLVELPCHDWAFTLLRQFLFDAYELVWLQAAKASAYTPLSQAVQKIVREERFHLQHTKLWTLRLGLGTEESNRRTQNALNELWPLCAQLFALLPGEDGLIAAGIVPDPHSLQAQWLEFTAPHLHACGLTIPNAETRVWSREEHTEHLAPLLAEMQSVARADADAQDW